MAKSKGKKPSDNASSGVGRAANKPPKKNPKPNGIGKTGRTIGGYSPAKLEERALKRKYAHLSQ
jgi:hypothetical protein